MFATHRACYPRVSLEVCVWSNEFPVGHSQAPYGACRRPDKRTEVRAIDEFAIRAESATSSASSPAGMKCVMLCVSTLPRIAQTSSPASPTIHRARTAGGFKTPSTPRRPTPSGEDARLPPRPVRDPCLRPPSQIAFTRSYVRRPLPGNGLSCARKPRRRTRALADPRKLDSQ